MFATIMGGALIGIGGMAFLFGETVKYQAEEQIQIILEGKENQIDDVVDHAENLAYSLGVSVSTLHIRKAETPETYQELTRQLFQGRTEYITGLGFGQRAYGILPSKEWFYPHYQAELGSVGSATYTDRADSAHFYPKTAAYRQYFLPQQDLWTTPYQSEQGIVLSYYSQIFDNEGKWLGTAAVDFDGTYLNTVIEDPVFQGGGQLMLLAQNGNVIANPANAKELENQTYKDIPQLEAIWSQIQSDLSSSDAPQLIEGESGYWSYNQISEMGWLLVAYVPYRVVFARVVAITLGATTVVGLLLAGLVTLAIRYLNRHLRPVINECQRLSAVDDAMSAKLKNKDELEQLSFSFFNLLDQLQLSQRQVQQKSAHASEVEAQLNQVKARSLASRERQRQLSLKIDNILPPQSSVKSPGDRTLQEELTQLNAVVSTLSGSDLLASVTESTESDTLATPELSQLSYRLDHTFAHVLAMLSHFSQVAASFHQTNEHAQRLEQAAIATEDNVQKQTALASQIQEWAIAAGNLSKTLAQQATALNEVGHMACLALTDEPAQTKPVALALDDLDENTHQLTEQARSLFDAVKAMTQRARKHKRIARVSQVLLSSASTLSISASRKQNPDEFREIIEQFRDKESEFKQLAEQLEQSRPQDDADQIQTMVSDLMLGIGAFEHYIQQLNTAIGDSKNVSDNGKYVAQKMTQEQARIIHSIEQLSALIAPMQQSIREMSEMAESAHTQANIALQQAQQVEQLTAEITAINFPLHESFQAQPLELTASNIPQI
ncbi:MAG: methyl-accepting chemotaxis protein [Phormidesmis sp.]